MNARPCQHPGCDDGWGNPRLTPGGMCPRCREQLRRVLGQLRGDHDRLAKLEPAKPRDNLGRKATTTGYGHPAEAASDLCREIAESLAGAHALYQAVLGGEKPNPLLRQGAKVHQSGQWLADNLAQIAELDRAGKHAAEWKDLRERAKQHGVGRPQQWVPKRCERCEGFTVWRVWDELEASYDHIGCVEPDCGWELDADLLEEWVAQAGYAA